MNRLFVPILAVILLFVSCTGEENDESGFVIVAADFPSFDAARAIAGDDDDGIVMLLPPGTESHSYDPTPRDMIRIAECDLVVYTGGPSDEWVRTIISSLDTPPASFALTDQVELLTEEHAEGMEEEEHDHNVHEIDEHVWTSPRNEIVIIRNLSELMAGLNPAMADDYRSNASSYISKIEELDTAFRSIVQTGKRHTLIFASRFPLLYFVREYGLEYYAAFPGCAEESEPSARTVAFLIDKARELEVPCILNIELSSQMIADVIAEEAGCDVMVFNTLHNVTASDFYSGKNYVDLMGENIGVLREALN